MKDINNSRIVINNNTLKVLFQQESKYVIPSYADNSML